MVKLKFLVPNHLLSPLHHLTVQTLYDLPYLGHQPYPLFMLLKLLHLPIQHTRDPLIFVGIQFFE